MTDVIVIDEEFEAAATAATTAGNELNALITSYLAIMRHASTGGTVAGDAAEALRKLVAKAEALQNQFSRCSESFSAAVNSFLSAVDTADTYLY